MERGEAAYEDYYKQDFWLSFQGDNARKHILLFGDESKSRFASQEEAAAAMTAVTVPVWQLSGGEKVSSTLTLSVHAALAEDVKEIFTEIYNDPGASPSTMWAATPGGGDSATGEHNCGTAIDINANGNTDPRRSGAGRRCWERNQSPLPSPPLLRGAHLCRARLELGRRRLGLQQRRFRGLPRLYALLLHGRVTSNPPRASAPGWVSLSPLTETNVRYIIS